MVKTGGLGDVVASLPGALREHNVRVRTVLPGYPAVMTALCNVRETVPALDILGYQARIVEGNVGDKSLFVIDIPALFDRAGNPYLTSDGVDWPDNGIRYACFSRAAALIAQGLAPGYVPDVVQTHDWQAGLTAAYLRFDRKPAPPVVHTIHNIAFQGLFPASDLARFGLPPEAMTIDGVEYYGDIGFLKAALQLCDWITTVSPTYAREIQSDPWGMGLDGLLRARSRRITGILNGVDTHEWDPMTDDNVVFPYQIGDLLSRRPNKRAFQAQFGLTPTPSAFLLGMVSRLTTQKGVDLVADVVSEFADEDLQFVVVGAGDRGIERRLRQLQRAYPGRFACHIGYSEHLGHRMQAAADGLLIPSRFEPCGLTQLYALRYGCVPIAARVGGLADTIIDANQAAVLHGTGTGFLFSPSDAPTLADAIRRAHDVYRNRPIWHQLQKNGARYDVSWGQKAATYAAIFRNLLAGDAASGETADFETIENALLLPMRPEEMRRAERAASRGTGTLLPQRRIARRPRPSTSAAVRVAS
ncbi:glycogen/starch synthase [Ameyamaea chiangmaiensis NBRC 103196]|nr:glycogen/starch synthase [Ameyamaea chiangmaiensis NBRC 103196]